MAEVAGCVVLDKFFKLVMFGLSTVLIEFVVCKHLNSLLCWLLALKCLGSVDFVSFSSWNHSLLVASFIRRLLNSFL